MPSKTSAKKPTEPTKPDKFRFVIRKYVIASSVQQALKYESKSPVHEVFVADRAEDRAVADPIGFEYTAPDEWASYGPHSKKRKPRPHQEHH